jgi:hypothetical protein
MGELKRAAKELKDTSPEISGVGSRVWKALARDEESSIILLEIMQECWQKRTVPAEWLKLHTTALPKKGDLSLPGNWRGISMAESLSKLHTTILKHRLGGLYESIVPEYCNGFRRGRGRADCIFTVKGTLRKRKAKGLCSYIIYWDIKKCFDRIPREFIWASMRKMGVCEHMVAAARATLDGTSCELDVEGVQRTVQMR